MKKFKKILFLALMVAALSCLFCQPAFAISEEEVQAQVDAVGKETVSGNVLIWFMCAILPPFRSRTPFRLSDLTARSTVDVPTFIDSASSAICNSSIWMGFDIFYEPIFIRLKVVWYKKGDSLFSRISVKI